MGLTTTTYYTSIEILTCFSLKEEKTNSNFVNNIINIEKGIYFMNIKSFKIPLALDYFKRANEFNLMRELINENVIPTLIIRNQLIFSKKYLVEFTSLMEMLYCDEQKVSRWKEEGGVIKTFIEYITKLNLFIKNNSIKQGNTVLFICPSQEIEEIKKFIQKLADMREISSTQKRVNNIMKEKLIKKLWKVQGLLIENRNSTVFYNFIQMNSLLSLSNQGLRDELILSGFGNISDLIMKKSYSSIQANYNESRK